MGALAVGCNCSRSAQAFEQVLPLELRLVLCTSLIAFVLSPKLVRCLRLHAIFPLQVRNMRFALQLHLRNELGLSILASSGDPLHSRFARTALLIKSPS